MKRLIFIIAVAFATTSLAAQTDVKVTTNDGVTTSGYFVDGTDSIYTIRHQVDKGGCYEFDTLSFRIKDISEVKMYGKTLVPVNGKLVNRNTLPNPEFTHYKSVDTYQLKPASPNIVIGNACKQTGSIAMGVGVPMMVVGTVLCAVGSRNQYSTLIEEAYDVKDINDAKKVSKSAYDLAEKKTSLNIAGGCLIAAGSAFTLIGIPLYIHGTKIMTMNFNYTGNGAGVALQF